MGKKYVMKPGQAYRPFGAQEAITDKNLQDTDVERLIKETPKLLGTVFFEIEKGGVPTAPAAGTADKDDKGENLSDLTKAGLADLYTQLTGQTADPKLNKADLLALVEKEQEAKKLLS